VDIFPSKLRKMKKKDRKSEGEDKGRMNDEKDRKIEDEKDEYFQLSF
jgi:hypothetical protein